MHEIISLSYISFSYYEVIFMFNVEHVCAYVNFIRILYTFIFLIESVRDFKKYILYFDMHKIIIVLTQS